MIRRNLAILLFSTWGILAPSFTAHAESLQEQCLKSSVNLASSYLYAREQGVSKAELLAMIEQTGAELRSKHGVEIQLHVFTNLVHSIYAGSGETAAIMAVANECVRLERILRNPDLEPHAALPQEAT